MVRFKCALVVASGVAMLSGCQSGPLARANRAGDTAIVSTPASGTPSIAAAASDLDPRVAKRTSKNWFTKPENQTGITKEYAAAKEKLKDPEKLMTAMARYQEEVSRNRKNPQALEIARQTYTTLLNDNPGSLNAMLGLARVDFKADRVQDAERMYKTVAAKFPRDPEALSAVAEFYNQTDRPEATIQLLPAAITVDPENRALRQQMGVALVKAGRHAEAVPHFTKVEGQANAYAHIGQMLSEQKDYSTAQDYLSRALKRDPQMEFARTALAKLNTAGGIRQASAQRNAQNQVRQATAAQLSPGIE